MASMSPSFMQSAYELGIDKLLKKKKSLKAIIGNIYTGFKLYNLSLQRLFGETSL